MFAADGVLTKTISTLLPDTDSTHINKMDGGESSEDQNERETGEGEEEEGEDGE